MRLTNIILLYIKELCVVGSTPTIPSKMGCSTVGSAIVLLDVKITASNKFQIIRNNIEKNT